MLENVDKSEDRLHRAALSAPAIAGIAAVCVMIIVMLTQTSYSSSGAEDFESILWLGAGLFSIALALQLLPYSEAVVATLAGNRRRGRWVRIVAETLVCSVPLIWFGGAALLSRGGAWMLLATPLAVNVYIVVLAIRRIGSRTAIRP